MILVIEIHRVPVAPTPDYVVSDVTHVRVLLFSTPGR